jgi:ferric-dicitrate binding protein FerR (iron transport regulator)
MLLQFLRKGRTMSEPLKAKRRGKMNRPKVTARACRRVKKEAPAHARARARAEGILKRIRSLEADVALIQEWFGGHFLEEE